MQRDKVAQVELPDTERAHVIILDFCPRALR